MSSPVNFVDYLLTNRAKYGERPAYRYFDNGSWLSVSWNAFLDHISRCATALLDKGIKPGDRIALYAPNCPQWSEMDYACMAINAVTVAIHATCSTLAARHIIEETNPRYVLVGDASLAARLQGDIDPQRLLLLNGSYPGAQSYRNFTDVSPRPEWSDGVAVTKPDDLWTIIYTSGTTGEMRGAMLTHRAIMSQIDAHRAVLPDLNDSDSSFCLLPLSHIFERGWSAIQYAWGLTNHYCSSTPQIIKAIQSAQPSIVCLVPRVLEKIYIAFKAHLAAKPAWFRAMVKHAITVGSRCATAEAAGNTPSAILRWQRSLFDSLLYKRIRALLGGKLKHCVVGSAALVPEVHRFFQAAGIFLNNGYGLTETTATITSTPVGKSLANTTGVPLGGLQIRLGENNEIQVKGPSVMKGYFNRPRDNEAAFTADGFFRTGDVGQFLANGYLRITDRIKDFIRTSTGTYVSPQHVEGLLSLCPLIDQAVVIGEGRSKLGALIVPNRKQLREYAQSKKLTFSDETELLHHPAVLEHVQALIDVILAEEAKQEQVHAIALLDTPFSVENGELTPTLKYRRSAIAAHYAQTIEAMFQS